MTHKHYVVPGRMVTVTVIGTNRLARLVRELAAESMFFAVMPLPHDTYEVTCREDRAPTLIELYHRDD